MVDSSASNRMGAWGRDWDDRARRRPVRLFAESAARLERWRAGGHLGPRPPGQLRPLVSTPVGPATRAGATAAYRTVYDPDGRPLASSAASLVLNRKRRLTR